MKKVNIINGTYGYRLEGSNLVTPVSAGMPPIEVSDEEADRLISLYVATIALEQPKTAVATPTGGDDGGGAGENTSDGQRGAGVEDRAHLEAEQLQLLTNAKLKELAEDMGIDASKLKTKAQLIAAISDIHLEDAIVETEDDEEEPPITGAAGPVV